MGILTLGQQSTFINNAGLFPMRFFKLDANNVNQDSDAAGSDALTLQSIGHFLKSAINGSVTAQRSRPATQHKLSIDAANPAQITVAADLPKGTTVRFRVQLLAMYGQLGELHQGQSDYGNRHTFAVTSKAANWTAAQWLKQLNVQMSDAIDYEHFETKYYVSTYTPGAADAPGVFTLEAQDSDWKLKLFAEEYQQRDTAAFDVFEPATVTPQYEGLGQYKNLHTRRLETDATVSPWNTQEWEGAEKGRSYTVIQFEKLVERDDLTNSSTVADGGPVTMQARYELLIQEGNAENETFITQLLDFLAVAGSPASSVKRSYQDHTGAEVATTALFVAAA